MIKSVSGNSRLEGALLRVHGTSENVCGIGMLRGRMRAMRLDRRTRYRDDQLQWPDRASVRRKSIAERGGGGEERGRLQVVGKRKARNYYLRGSWSMLRSLCSIGCSAYETISVPRVVEQLTK